MRKKDSFASKIISWIIFIVLLFVIYKLFGVFRTNYFNDFTKGESNLGISKFTRDSEIKYSKNRSYKIESQSQNNAAFYKEIDVVPNTPYKVTCFVKTENVIPEKENSDGGANICLIEAPEISKSIVGTNQWQQIEMIFNSQNRKKVQIGFRLGGNTGTAKGTAWFSDFKVEKGLANDSSLWNVGCFIFKNIDVKINGEEYKFTTTTSDIQEIKSNMQRFKSSCESLSKEKMQVKYNIHEINDPITSISYSDEHGYYIDPYDVNKYIEDIVMENEYDYIFIALRMGNKEKQIPVKEWIGLRKYGFIWNWFFKYSYV